MELRKIWQISENSEREAIEKNVVYKGKAKGNDHKIILILFLSNKLPNLRVNVSKTAWRKYFDPSRPNIHMQFLQTDLYTFH